MAVPILYDLDEVRRLVVSMIAWLTACVVVFSSR